MSQIENLAYSGVGCYNDIDMLICGMYGAGNVANGGCTDEEYKTHFALWCMFSSPLMLGSDLRKLKEQPFILDLIKNKNLIRINQDEESRPAFAVNGIKDRLTLAKHLSDNEIAIMFANLADDDGHCELFFDELGIPAASGYGLEMKDCFTGETMVKKEYFRHWLKAHSCEVYICKLVKYNGFLSYLR